MIYYNYNSFSPGVRLDIMGDLKLNQRQPLFSHGKDKRFNKPIVNYNEMVNDNFNIKKVLQDYFSRNGKLILIINREKKLQILVMKHFFDFFF